MKDKRLKEWNREKKMIPIMIQRYCKGNHHTKGELCNKCKELKEYALYRLERCPFKINKQFCSTCKVHCYNKEMQDKIKQVMRWSGPRMLLTNPIYVFSHIVKSVKHKIKLRKQVKENA